MRRDRDGDGQMEPACPHLEHAHADTRRPAPRHEADAPRDTRRAGVDVEIVHGRPFMCETRRPTLD